MEQGCRHQRARRGSRSIHQGSFGEGLFDLEQRNRRRSISRRFARPILALALLGLASPFSNLERSRRSAQCCSRRLVPNEKGPGDAGPEFGVGVGSRIFDLAGCQTSNQLHCSIISFATAKIVPLRQGPDLGRLFRKVLPVVANRLGLKLLWAWISLLSGARKSFESLSIGACVKASRSEGAPATVVLRWGRITWPSTWARTASLRSCGSCSPCRSSAPCQ